MTSSTVIDLINPAWSQMLPGVQVKPVWTDEATDRRALLIRFEAGAALTRHVHNGDEVLYVIEGAVGDDHGTVTAGNVGYRPPGCTHTVRSPGGAKVFAVVSGGVAPAGEDDHSGPPSQVFNAAEVTEIEARPGVFQRPMWADAAGERRAFLGRYAPGSGIARHRHNGDELIYVLEGTVDDEYGSVTAGNAGFRADGCVHTVSSPGGALVFAVLRGGVEAAG